MNLIAFNGFKRAGKGEAANAAQSILEFRGDRVVQVGFADKVKIWGARSLGFDRPDDELIALMDSMKDKSIISMLYDEPDVEPSPWFDTCTMNSLSGREYLQNIGANARKLFGEDFWVDQVLRPNERAFPDADAVLITDLRYPNEAERVIDLGGRVIEVVRPGRTSDGHESEQPLARGLITTTIQNDGDLDALKVSVEGVLA